jgi:hypothetical protein
MATKETGWKNSTPVTIQNLDTILPAKEPNPTKTSGIKVRGGKAQTKGKMARGPMG